MLIHTPTRVIRYNADLEIRGGGDDCALWHVRPGQETFIMRGEERNIKRLTADIISFRVEGEPVYDIANYWRLRGNDTIVKSWSDAL